MAYRAWTTKEEVLKDLAEASGMSRRRLANLDEGYFVVGDAPPPVMRENVDAEMEILFGRAVRRTPKPVEEEVTQPDLQGITHLIRMVDDFNSQQDDDNIDDFDAANAGDCVIAISKVSKLNPNVQEFKPRNKQGLISPSRQFSNKDNINSSFVKQTVGKTEESKKETEVEMNGKETGNNNGLEVELNGKETSDNNGLEVELNDNVIKLNVDKNDYEDMATTLKNQISIASKSDSFEFKKQKNVAIYTLMKLYSKNKPPASSAPVKLITPEYFEGKVAPLDSESTETSSTPEPQDSSTTLPSCSFSTSTSSTNLTSSKKRLDPEVKKSIDKVSRWLDEPPVRKSPTVMSPLPDPQPKPAVCLGPIAFKRKDPVKINSPVSDSAPPAHRPAQSQQYQPSKYATDLGQKYEQRNKVLEAKKKEVTWTNLEEVLKAKDLEIKKRKAQEQSSTSSNS